MNILRFTSLLVSFLLFVSPVYAGKISARSAATTPLTGAETIGIIQGGADSKTTVNDIAGRNGLNPFSYSTDLATGITAILATGTGSGFEQNPLEIYIPAGTYQLTAPIRITRHRVTLIIDGGAKIIPVNGSPAIWLDGPSNGGSLVGIVIRSYGVLSGIGSSATTDFVYINGSLQFSDLFFNRLAHIGRHAINIDGDNFGNKISFNAIEDCGGWGINNGSAAGDLFHEFSIAGGEIFSCAGGGINASRFRNGSITGVIEGNTAGQTALLLTDCLNIDVRMKFENTTGHDIDFGAVSVTNRGITLNFPTGFSGKNAPYYNINISTDFSVYGLFLNGIDAQNLSSRFMNVSTATARRVIFGVNAWFDPTAVTVVAGAEVRVLQDLPQAQFKSINVTTGTLASHLLTGAEFSSVLSTNAAPGTQTTRTAAQLLADEAYESGRRHNMLIGYTWRVRVTNSGAGTFTLAAGTNVTLAGTMTIPTNTWREFVCTVTAYDAITIQSIGTGTI